MLKKDYPNLAKEWDYKKNGENGIFFEDITFGSGKEAWWICDKGHHYQLKICDRTRRHLGCPYCSGHRLLEGFNDFATKCPQLLKEWDYDKNNKLGIFPNKIGVGFKDKVWWKCPKGHSYDSVIFPRTHGVGCPYCSNRRVLAGLNDVATTNPELIKYWDYEKNVVKPTEISRGYSGNIWWKCPKGHSYQATIINNSKEGCGCPYCSGRRATSENNLLTKYPELAKEWDYEKNTVDPTSLSLGGKQKFWWQCEKGHKWEATVYTRTADGHVSSCPICKKRLRISFPEKAIFFYLKKVFPDAEENYRPAWLNGKELDIFLPSKRIGIEYDGYWHRLLNKDLDKDSLCEANGVKLVRIRENCLQELKTSSSLVFTLPQKNKPDCSHIIPGLIYLEGILDVNLNINITRDYNEIKKLVIDFDKENCIAKTNPECLAEWDYEKNNEYGITPNNTSAGVSFNVYWKCPKGHSYQAAPSNKINGGTSCPYCTGKRVLIGFNDLATTEPELLEKWDYKKNTIKPTEVSSGANKKVWLICDKGHSYSVLLLNHRRSGCPYCSGHKVLAGFNDLATTHPELAKEWDYKKNKAKPTEVGKGHIKKIWWICPKGHSYASTPNGRTSKKLKCPYCSGQRVLAGFNDIATTNPELLAIWDYKKNIIKPTDISKGSRKKVWLKCENGHSYETTIPSKLSGCKCNYCSGNKILIGYNDLITINPQLAKEWNYEKNGNLKPQDFTSNSSKKVWWRCSKGHEWEATIGNRNQGRGCPICSNRITVPGLNDLSSTNPTLAKEWNYEKNGDLKPRDFTSNNGKKVWWRCSKGHEWEATIVSRNKGVGCPFCSGRNAIAGVNDLATIKKSLLKQWDYEKNGSLKPTDITANSGKKVWWNCPSGHKWQSAPHDLHHSSVRCPYCTRKKIAK